MASRGCAPPFTRGSRKAKMAGRKGGLATARKRRGGRRKKKR
jgi:hypothetical protein